MNKQELKETVMWILHGNRHADQEIDAIMKFIDQYTKPLEEEIKKLKFDYENACHYAKCNWEEIKKLKEEIELRKSQKELKATPCEPYSVNMHPAWIAVNSWWTAKSEDYTCSVCWWTFSSPHWCTWKKSTATLDWIYCWMGKRVVPQWEQHNCWWGRV